MLPVPFLQNVSFPSFSLFCKMIMTPFSDTANLKHRCFGDCVYSRAPPPHPEEYLTFYHFHFVLVLVILNKTNRSGAMASLPSSAPLNMPSVSPPPC